MPNGHVVPDSPVANAFILAHRQRWCVPGDPASNACRHDPNPRAITFVVLHAIAGPSIAAQIRAWQNPPDPRHPASAHYLVDRDGQITQMVREANVAFHAFGNNRNSIGIEHADLCNDPAPYTTELYEASAALVRDIAARNHFPITRLTVLTHEALGRAGGATDDPGAYFDLDFYFQLLTWDGHSVAEKPVRVVSSVADRPPAARPDGWTENRRRRIAGDRCAEDGDPYGATFWTCLPEARVRNPGRIIPGVDFQLLVDRPGVYKASLWWPRVRHANTAAPVEIAITQIKLLQLPVPETVSQGVTVDQSANFSRWNDVGENFTVVLPPAIVRISIGRRARTPGTIVADAVRLLRIRSA